MDEMLGVTKDNFKELNMFCSVKEIFLFFYKFSNIRISKNK